jgi:alkaline phosphatase D
VKSAFYFWVGSEAPIGGFHPSYWKSYDEWIPYRDRVDQVIEWLEYPVGERPGLITLYFDEPDGTGHYYGPEHDSTRVVVEYLDGILGYLRTELNRLDHYDRINLIVLSDHGMGSISPDKYTNIEAPLKEGWTESIIGGNPVYLIDPEEGFADSVTTVLNRLPGVNAWQAGDIPVHLHYGESPRFPGIAVVADSSWSIGTHPDPFRYTGGAHGYDPAFTGMHTIFYAEGPAFKAGYESPPISNVDIYAILARVLGLEPAANDGDLQRVIEIFDPEFL